MKRVCTSETSANFYHITRRHITYIITLHSHRCENLTHNKNFWAYAVSKTVPYYTHELDIEFIQYIFVEIK
jgi:hypothetical protein